jgi:RHS repeat-associated protein
VAAAYAQNGNILAHADSVMGTWNFTYDAVDRLMTAQQTAYTATSQKYAGNYGCWNWTYDSFGNRTLEAYSATSSCGSNLTPEIGASYNQANNQIQSVWGTTAATFVYDASGNTQNDGVNKYWYDAEGQLCAVERTIGGPITQYIYDAEGARIGKGTLSTAPATGATCAPPMSSGFTLATRWLVGLGGDQVTELNSAGNWAHSNIFAAGKLTATYDTNGIHFELSDPLGTKRVQANASGQVDEYCTSLPFGNDLTNPLGASCTGSDDATEHHFTGKERDTESGNDYFGARYYASSMGRLMSPDWAAVAEPVPYAKLGDPQTLNLYSYVGNNPLTHIDPDGHQNCTKTTLSFFINGQPAGSISSTVCMQGLDHLEENAYRAATAAMAAMGHHGIPRSLFRYLPKGEAKRWLEREFTTGELEGGHGWSQAHKLYNETVRKLLKLDTPEGRQELIDEGLDGAKKAAQRVLDSENPNIRGFLDGMKTPDGLTGRQALEGAMEGDAEAILDVAVDGAAGLAAVE